jgi:glutamate N-acetyltransferase/amino-acid N-acetyltransferase
MSGEQSGPPPDSILPVPGFSWYGANIGIKDDSLDFGVIASARPCTAAGVFTRSNFPAAPVIVGREHLRSGRLQAVVVNSKSANAATGFTGIENARGMCRFLGAALGIAPELVLPSSTAVIGMPLPMEKIEAACRAAPQGLAPDAEAIARFARAIMTTDTRPKVKSVRIGRATLTGVAKGAGMIEPNMATMLSYLVTDAEVPAAALQAMLARCADRSFNRITIDGDTSTNDTVVVLANGLAGAVDGQAFEAGLLEAMQHLAREIVRDGEGATKLIEIAVTEAPSEEAALAIAKSIANSPLVKTAIYGADPNWGRFVMAIGKVYAHPVPIERLAIHFGEPGAGMCISAGGHDAAMLERIRAYLRQPVLRIDVRLGSGAARETVWTCDLTEGYIKENAYYTS